MDIYKENKKVMDELVAYFGTDAAVARALSMSRQGFNYQRHYAQKVDAKEYTKKVNLLNKIKKENERSVGRRTFEPWSLPVDAQEKRFIERVLEAAKEAKDLPYYARLKVAKVFMQEAGERRGRPCHLPQNQEEIRLMSDEFKGRMDDFIAKAFGLGGKDKYRAAEKIEREGREELMQAIHDHQLSVFAAQQLLPATALEVRRALSEGKDAVRALILQQQGKPSRPALKVEMISFYQNQQLLKLEQDSDLPLRIVLAGVLACCDTQGCFSWEPAQLKAAVANAALELPVELSLEALCEFGWIQKSRLGEKHCGHVLCIKQFLAK